MSLPAEKLPGIQPGIYPDIENETYHSGPGISKSHLDIINRAPSTYKFRVLEGNRKEGTAAMNLGSAVHSLVLEPDKFGAEFAVAPKVDKRTKAGKAEWAAFEEASKGKILLSEQDLERAEAMAGSVFCHPVAGALFKNGTPEQSVYWVDEETDLLCKCRPDWLRNDAVIVDLKTSADAGSAGFAKSCANFRYFVQDPWYRHGCTQAGVSVDQFVFVVVESEAPYNVAVYELDPQAVAHGHDVMRDNLNRIATHSKHEFWPSYNQNEITTINLPKWAYYA